MIEKTIHVLLCSYCKKKYQYRNMAEKHEKACRKNPENYRPCLDGCIHLRKKETFIDDGYDWSGDERRRKVELFYCGVFNKFLYTPQNEVKKNVFETDEVNDPMPKECQEYEIYEYKN